MLSILGSHQLESPGSSRLHGAHSPEQKHPTIQYSVAIIQIHCRFILSGVFRFRLSRVKRLDESHEVTRVKGQGSRVFNRRYIIAPLIHVNELRCDVPTNKCG